MKILSMDTSSDVCSVALLEDDRIIDEIHNQSEKEHSQSLMPMIKELLEKNRITLDDIDLVASGIGPGSFTGIRIGIATTKAFSDAKNIPVVGVNSLEAQAYMVLLKEEKENSKILSMIDARNENAYVAVYRYKNDNLSVYKNPEIMSISNAPEYLDFKDNVYIIGNVPLEKVESMLRARASKEQAQGVDIKKYKFVNSNNTFAEAIGVCAYYKYQNGLAGDSNSIEPMYLNLSQAEKQKKNLDDEKIYINEMSISDKEEIESNYNKFPNIWDERTFEEDARNSKYFVAKQDNQVVGFVSYTVVLDEVEIMNIVTREDSRNQGIASSLLSYIIRKIDYNKINLEVNENNKTALNLYRKFGFKNVGQRKNYYNGKEDAILMSL